MLPPENNLSRVLTRPARHGISSLMVNNPFRHRRFGGVASVMLRTTKQALVQILAGLGMLWVNG
jgi:hypothetical protein